MIYFKSIKESFLVAIIGQINDKFTYYCTTSAAIEDRLDLLTFLQG